MALTSGFFDATYNSETRSYDRAYNSANFTEYFAEILGSGVCVYGNENSMLVSVDGTTVTVAAGYLFINGYWLKNDAEYTFSMLGAEAGTYAIVARLDLSSRLFTLGYEETAESYNSALVLAYVTMSGSGTLSATDTRADTSLCGKIDSAGATANKIAAALNYINNNIPAAFSAYEDQLDDWKDDVEASLSDLDSDVDSALSSLSTAVNAKLDAVDEEMETLPLPKVGEIKYSAAGAESGWLLCDGSYVGAAQYPALVAALGKLSPGAGEFVVRSQGQIGREISNGYIYNGRMWVYSFQTQTLYGVSLSGVETVSIPVASASTGFSALVSPSVVPICLTILDGYLFLTQWRTGSTDILYGIIPTNSNLTVLSAPNFTGSEESLTLTDEFSGYTEEIYSMGHSLPYVQKETVEGTSYFVMCVGDNKSDPTTYGNAYVYGYYREAYWKWETGSKSISVLYAPLFCYLRTNGSYSYQSADQAVHVKYCFNRKNNSEMIYLVSGGGQYAETTNNIYSIIRNLYGTSGAETGAPGAVTTNETAIAGADEVYLGGAYDGLVRYTTFENPKLRGSVDISGKFTLPNGSQRFADAAVYCANKSMWFFFVGTGLIFTHDIADANAYGFLDTTETLGALSYFGYMDYDADTSKLVIVGQDSSNTVRVATLDLSNWQYSDTGAYLPTLSSGGIPGYIKAVAS